MLLAEAASCKRGRERPGAAASGRGHARRVRGPERGPEDHFLVHWRSGRHTRPMCLLVCHGQAASDKCGLGRMILPALAGRSAYELMLLLRRELSVQVRSGRLGQLPLTSLTLLSGPQGSSTALVGSYDNKARFCCSSQLALESQQRRLVCRSCHTRDHQTIIGHSCRE